MSKLLFLLVLVTTGAAQANCTLKVDIETAFKESPSDMLVIEKNLEKKGYKLEIIERAAQADEGYILLDCGNSIPSTGCSVAIRLNSAQGKILVKNEVPLKYGMLGWMTQDMQVRRVIRRTLKELPVCK